MNLEILLKTRRQIKKEYVMQNLFQHLIFDL